MAVQAHIHKYHLVNIGTKTKPRKVYACARPDCSHFMPNKSLVINKQTLCWQCGEVMLMSKDLTNLTNPVVKPRCYKCRETTKKVKPGKETKVDTAKLDRFTELMLQLKG